MLQLIDTMYPEITFVAAELTELAETMNKPVVKKYLHLLGVECLKAIATGQPKEAKPGVEAEDAESYLRRQAVVQGQLATIQTLLAIEAPAKQA